MNPFVQSRSNVNDLSRFANEVDKWAPIWRQDRSLTARRPVPARPANIGPPATARFLGARVRPLFFLSFRRGAIWPGVYLYIDRTSLSSARFKNKQKPRALDFRVLWGS